jgi:hypothetical protein
MNLDPGLHVESGSFCHSGLTNLEQHFQPLLPRLLRISAIWVLTVVSRNFASANKSKR